MKNTTGWGVSRSTPDQTADFGWSGSVSNQTPVQNQTPGFGGVPNQTPGFGEAVVPDFGEAVHNQVPDFVNQVTGFGPSFPRQAPGFGPSFPRQEAGFGSFDKLHSVYDDYIALSKKYIEDTEYDRLIITRLKRENLRLRHKVRVLETTEEKEEGESANKKIKN